MPAVQLLDYQKRCFLDRSRFKVLMWARGARKTFTSTLEIVDSIFESEAKGRRCEWIIVSRGERQALEALKEAKRHCQAYEIAASDIIESQVWSKQAKQMIKVTEIMFPMGSRIRALPALPDIVRGYSANVYLDEFDIHPDATEIWRAAYPVLRGKYRMIVSSSPKRKGSKFYEIVTGEGVWARHIVDIYQAVEQGLPFDIEYERKALGDDDAWAQEYELQWLDEASAWLSYELIETCEDDDADQPDLYQGKPCYVGIDIARRHDLWAAWVLEPIGDVLWCRELVELRRASFAEQDAVIDRLMRQYKVVRMAIDQTGMGEKVVEDCQRRYGESVVEGVTFSAPKKLSLATIGKQKFEARRVRIPARAEVRQDLHSLKKSTTAIGNVRFDADRENGSHADRAWALFLALYAAGDGAVDWSGFESISKGANSSPYDFDFADGLSDFSGWN